MVEAISAARGEYVELTGKRYRGLAATLARVPRRG
jgi:hypothetical protein